MFKSSLYLNISFFTGLWSILINFLYCIVLYLQPVLNPKSYDGAQVFEASGRPMLVIGRSYELSIQVDEMITGVDEMTKLAEETIVLYCIVFAARTEP